jgi:hypothetical protein
MRFLRLINAYENRDISLDVLVKPSTPEEPEKLRYYADCSTGQLVVTMTVIEGAGIEVVRGRAGDRPCKSLGGRFLIRGDFLVRGGGFHQGISSLGLLPPRRGKAHSVDRRERPRVRF